MSSILDSLKKLEKETARQDHVLTRVRSGNKAAFPKFAVGIAGFICICIGALGLAAYYRGYPQEAAELPAVAPAPYPEPSASMDDPQEPPLQEPGASVPPPFRAAGSLAAETAAVPQEPAVDRKLTQPSTPGSEQQDRSDTGTGSQPDTSLPSGQDGSEALAAKPPDSTMPAPVEEAVDARDGLSANTPAREAKPETIDRLQGAGLKIQAISWSDTPERSLAVVNNQVLHEGDEIEGYQISRINPDDIVLRRSGKAFRLDFRSSGMQ